MPADFLQLAEKKFLVTGVANRKSVAWHVARTLRDAGAEVLYSVHTEQRREGVRQLLAAAGDGDAQVFVCDVADEGQVARLGDELAARDVRLHGLLHSIAYAPYGVQPAPFHETPKEAFLRTVDVSCYSLLSLARALASRFDADASVVTISISTTRMASESYGFMAPAKAALDSAVAFLAKSFSRTSRVRFNAVAAGLLKTASSAGIPGYVDAYLYAEQATLRHAALSTQEVAHVAAFLLSPRSSGINAQRVVADAGMETNYFDQDLIRRATGGGS